jgi:hypothetical protein
MIANKRVVDGQNISLVDALGLGFKRLDDQQFELQEGNKKFVLSNLVGVVKEIPQLEEDIEAGNSANGEQEIKKGAKQTANNKNKRESNDTSDNIQLAADPIKEHSFDKENANETKALEQKGFHVIGEDGYQSGAPKNNNVNKENGHQQLQREEENRFKKSKKS